MTAAVAAALTGSAALLAAGAWAGPTGRVDRSQRARDRTSAVAAANKPPPVPGAGRGVYLGAFVNPKAEDRAGQEPGLPELGQTPAFERQIGRPLAILHFYTAWKIPAPTGTLSTIEHRFGAIPLISWQCADPLAKIADGADDQLIYRYAIALKSVGGPIFLRWHWEMNLKTSQRRCPGTPARFKAAWKRIWKIFHGQLKVNGKKVKARNVAFVWAPGLSKKNYAAYFPGSAFVDWIGADGYSRPNKGRPTFPQLFGGWYGWARAHDPQAPLMVSETGTGMDATRPARGQIQGAYFNTVRRAIANDGPMDAIQAFVYFDSIGAAQRGTGPGAGSVLKPGRGLDAFARLGRVFTFGEPCLQTLCPNPTTNPAATVR